MQVLRRLSAFFGRRPWEHGPRAAFVFLLAAPLAAQTVRSLIEEYVVKALGKLASARIEYINGSLEDLVVTMNLQRYTVSDTGELTFGPLDGNIHVKLTAMSSRPLCL